MSLLQARAELNKALKSGTFPALVMNSWASDIRGLIWRWWSAYKAWEEQDRFNVAFGEDRIVMRAWDDVLDKAHDLVLPHDRIWDTHKKAVDEKSPAVEEFKSAKYKFSVGMKSLAARTNPANFYPGAGGASRKYELGLHDMSCTLLDHRRAISSMMHLKGHGVIVSFMALSDPDDQVVFHNLNRFAKELRAAHVDFYNTIREFRSKMTRIKLAAEHDMGTGFTAVMRENGPSWKPPYKLTYGLGTTTKVIDEAKSKRSLIGFGGKLKAEAETVTDKMRQARRDAALDFKSILKRQLFAKNEITVAFRDHAGPFPIFAQYDEPNNKYDVFSIAGEAKNFTGAILDRPLGNVGGGLLPPIPPPQ